MKYKLTFDIEPVAQARPRVTRWGTYDPPKSKAFKQTVRLLAKQQWHREPLTGQLNIKLTFFRKLQKNLSKKERLERVSGVHRPTVKPDLDNYIKGALDALNGLIWLDDNRIVKLDAEKFYAEQAKWEIEIWEDKK